jgi:membrane protein involved in colicin uptake
MPEPIEPAAPVDPATPALTDPATPTEPTTPEPKDWQAEAERWKRQSRENETRAKANAEAAKRLAQIEEDQKTEAEKAADRVAAAEARASKAAERAVAASIKAAATGRFADPDDAVDALARQNFTGADGEIDEDAIAAALDDLLERKKHWALAEPGPRTPRPDPSQGPRPGGTASVDAQIAEAQSKGDWKTVLHLQNSKLAPPAKAK